MSEWLNAELFTAVVIFYLINAVPSAMFGIALARRAGRPWWHGVLPAFLLPWLTGLALLGRERRFVWPLSLALLLSLMVPVVFWSGSVVALIGKIAIATLILVIAFALVLAGAGGGVRRLTIAGSGLFAVAVLILLWQTIGTLLDQSLFFLVAGAALLAIASGARRLFARLNPPEKEAA